MSNDSREVFNVDAIMELVFSYARDSASYYNALSSEVAGLDESKAETERKIREALSRHNAEREALVRQCADAVMKVYVNPTPEELGVMYDCRDAVLKAPNRYIRQEQHDKRIARGDDFAGDAWLDKETDEVVYGVVGHDMNGKSAILSDSGSQG